MLDYKKCFQPSNEVVGRFIDDEVVIVPVKGDIAKQNAIFSLENTAAKIWPLIEAKKNVGDILEFILTNMDVSKQDASNDLSDFLQDLLSIGVIQEAKEK